MTVFVVVLSWLLIQFMGGATLIQRDDVFIYWHKFARDRLSSIFDELIILVIIILEPIFIILSILLILGEGIVAGFLTLLIVLFCCGRGDIISKLQAFKFSLGRDDGKQLINSAQGYFNINTTNDHDVYGSVRSQVCYQCYERWFAVIFWFLLLGVPGALLYRFCHIIAMTDESSSNIKNLNTRLDDQSKFNTSPFSEEFTENTIKLIGFLDWLPCRLWVVMLAVWSYFDTIFSMLSKNFFKPIKVASLLESALASIKNAEKFENEDTELDSIKNELSLQERIDQRAMITSLVIILLLVSF